MCSVVGHPVIGEQGTQHLALEAAILRLSCSAPRSTAAATSVSPRPSAFTRAPDIAL